jgi:hypothetical protein
VSFDLDRARAVDDSLRGAGVDLRDAPEERYRAQERRIRVEVDRDIPRGTVVLRGARVITMRGDEVIENADVVVRDNRIQGVGPRGEAPGRCPGDRRGGPTPSCPGSWTPTPTCGTRPESTWDDVWIYQANLAYGVTTTRDPQTGTSDVSPTPTWWRRARSWGPGSTRPAPASSGRRRSGTWTTPGTLLRRYSDYWDTKTIKMYVAGNRQQRQWIIMAARELELMPTTEGGWTYRHEPERAMDGYPGIEHNMPIIPVYAGLHELFPTPDGSTRPRSW